MDEMLCLREFEKLAQRLGITLRYTIGAPSGLCTVKGEQVLFLDRMNDKKSQLDVYIREFKTLDLEDVFIVPVIRRLLDLENDPACW